MCPHQTVPIRAAQRGWGPGACGSGGSTPFPPVPRYLGAQNLGAGPHRRGVPHPHQRVHVHVNARTGKAATLSTAGVGARVRCAGVVVKDGRTTATTIPSGTTGTVLSHTHTTAERIVHTVPLWGGGPSGDHIRSFPVSVWARGQGAPSCAGGLAPLPVAELPLPPTTHHTSNRQRTPTTQRNQQRTYLYAQVHS